jgi:hypothetical protein
MRFRPKAAYETTVETTIYCAPEMGGKGIGTRLYSALFEAIANEDIRYLGGSQVADLVESTKTSRPRYLAFGCVPFCLAGNGRRSLRRSNFSRHRTHST